MSTELTAALREHRPALLRHCYRMLGCYAEAEDLLQDALERAFVARDSYRGDAPLKRWLFTIVTNTCLNALARRRQRSLPQLESEAATAEFVIGERESSRFITPGPDARLFPSAEEQAESRQTVALAFLALLQRVPPKPRAALLLKDVLGWSADEIAEALSLSVPAVHSALHRGRAVVGRDERASELPTPALLDGFVRAWESRDLDGLVALLRHDIELAMPPYTLWFRGVASVVGFLRSAIFSDFWASGVRLTPTRANGLPAFGFYFGCTAAAHGNFHSIMTVRFTAGQVAEMTVFLGQGTAEFFDLPLILERTVSETPIVMKGGDPA